MDLTDRQRRLAFAGIVVALAAVGVYLTLPGTESGDSASSRTSTPTAAAPTAPATSPPGISSTVSPENFDIYRLLPFSRRDFATAADMVQRFTAAYGTYRHDEDPAAYGERLRPYVTDQLLTDLQRSAAAPGVIEEHKRQQIVAVGSASIDAIRDIESNSMIFEVTGRQQVTRADGNSQDSKRYAVTASREGNAWRIYAFEPVDVGQEGDTG